jgi:hypothetical protein
MASSRPKWKILCDITTKLIPCDITTTNFPFWTQKLSGTPQSQYTKLHSAESQRWNLESCNHSEQREYLFLSHAKNTPQHDGIAPGSWYIFYARRKCTRGPVANFNLKRAKKCFNMPWHFLASSSCHCHGRIKVSMAHMHALSSRVYYWYIKLLVCLPFQPLFSAFSRLSFFTFHFLLCTFS